MEKLKLLFVVFLMVLSFDARGELIHLKSGKVIDGEIIERNDECVRVDIGGVTLTYYLDEIDASANASGVSGGNEYVNGDYNFKIQFPAGWSKEEITVMIPPQVPRPAVFFYKQKPFRGSWPANTPSEALDNAIKGNPSINLEVWRNSKEEAKEMFEEGYKALASSDVTKELRAERDITINGLNASKFSYSYEGTDNASYVLYAGNVNYFVNICTSPNGAPLAELEGIIESFRLVKRGK